MNKMRVGAVGTERFATKRAECLVAVAIFATAMVGCSTNRETQDSDFFATIQPRISLPASLNKPDTNFKLNNDGRLLLCGGNFAEKYKLNHLYETTGTTIDALAMQELPEAVTKGKITFKAQAMSALNAGRRNALIAFGDGDKAGDKMMWAGVYVGAKAYTLQSLNPKTYEVRADIFVKDDTFDPTKVFELQIEIDLTSRIASVIIDGKKRGEMQLPETIKQITHYGYAHHKNTLTYYSDIDVEIEK